ncbi:hypothetical protein C8Q74DRAFT_547001 [Fomes fomentarius]|nr:hypothetical protein C8Q74DRAFT_547001 [Fomes fomentarius]
MRVHIGMNMSDNWHSAVSTHGVETSRMPAESSIHNMRTPCLPSHWHNVYAMRPHGHASTSLSLVVLSPPTRLPPTPWCSVSSSMSGTEIPGWVQMMALTRVRTGHMMSVPGDASGHSRGGRELGMWRWAFVEDTIQAWCMRIRCAGAGITACFCVPRTYTPQATGNRCRWARQSVSGFSVHLSAVLCPGVADGGQKLVCGICMGRVHPSCFEFRSLFCGLPLSTCARQLSWRSRRPHSRWETQPASKIAICSASCCGVNVNVWRRWEGEWWMAKAEFEAKEGHVCCRCENHSAIHQCYHPPLHACSREDGGLGETCTAGGDSGSEHMRARIGRPAARPSGRGREKAGRHPVASRPRTPQISGRGARQE